MPASLCEATRCSSCNGRGLCIARSGCGLLVGRKGGGGGASTLPAPVLLLSPESVAGFDLAGGAGLRA